MCSTLISSKDTINNDASIDLALFHKVQLNVFTKSTGIIIVDGLGIAKGFQYWTKRKNYNNTYSCIDEYDKNNRIHL